MAWSRAVATIGLALAAIASAIAACTGDEPSPSAAPVVADAGAALCVSGKATASYPPPPYELSIAEIAPPGLSFEGPDGAIAIESFFEPCAERARVLVVRSSAGWCGPCQWHAAHTKRFTDDPRFVGRILLLDLLIADEDNAPATLASLASWRAKIDAPAKLAIDPRYTFGPALLARAPLPEYVFIDTRTMKILSTLSDPDPESLASRLSIELADLDHIPRPPAVVPARVDEHFTENQFDLIRGMRLPTAPPPDPTNEYGDVPAAAAFGEILFSDTLLSPSNVACVRCHDSGQDFTDGLTQSLGIARVDRYL